MVTTVTRAAETVRAAWRSAAATIRLLQPDERAPHPTATATEGGVVGLDVPPLQRDLQRGGTGEGGAAASVAR